MNEGVRILELTLKLGFEEAVKRLEGSAVPPGEATEALEWAQELMQERADSFMWEAAHAHQEGSTERAEALNRSSALHARYASAIASLLPEPDDRTS
jgi:hypothetical protein